MEIIVKTKRMFFKVNKKNFKLTLTKLKMLGFKVWLKKYNLKPKIQLSLSNTSNLKSMTMNLMTINGHKFILKQFMVILS